MASYRMVKTKKDEKCSLCGGVIPASTVHCYAPKFAPGYREHEYRLFAVKFKGGWEFVQGCDEKYAAKLLLEEKGKVATHIVQVKDAGEYTRVVARASGVTAALTGVCEE